MKRFACAWIAAAAALAAPASATAAITSVFGGQTVSGNPVSCTTLSDGVRSCHGADAGATGTPSAVVRPHAAQRHHHRHRHHDRHTHRLVGG